MTTEDLIRQVYEDASEWTEMIENPDELIIEILAQKVVKLKDHIIYLEKRIKYDACANTRTIH